MKMIDQEKRRNVPADAVVSPVSEAAHALDGSQFRNVIEEQVWSDLPPTADEQAPRRVRDLDEPEGAKHHPDKPAISVGEN